MTEQTVQLKRCAECDSANEPDANVCDGCGHMEFLDPEPAGTELECNHCGDVAVESPKGLFHEDMADKCVSCGFPGQVHVDEGDAHWASNQDDWHVRCEKDKCEECSEANRDEVMYLRELVVSTLPILERYAGELSADAEKARMEIMKRYGFMYAGAKP
jgi:hypothetical protein